MKVKIGTTLEADLYEQILGRARERGIRINEIFEEALRAYLGEDGDGVDYVAESFGSYQVSSEVFDEIVESDIFES